MQDILKDLVAHTHSLGFIPMIKITGTDTETSIEAMAEDRSCVITGKTLTPVTEFQDVFGMPNLDKLALHLKNPEYKENAKIQVVTAERNGEDVPDHLHFENASGDFENNYRFMSREVITEKLKKVNFKGATWAIDFEPNVTSIQRLRLQAAAHTEESCFQVRTENDNLVFFFGDASTHSGSFTFHSPAGGKLKQAWAWPVTQVMSILALGGDKTIKISDGGAMQITVNSGLAEYNYILPAQTK
jgi:hypothetical protein